MRNESTAIYFRNRLQRMYPFKHWAGATKLMKDMPCAPMASKIIRASEKARTARPTCISPI